MGRWQMENRQRRTQLQPLQHVYDMYIMFHNKIALRILLHRLYKYLATMFVQFNVRFNE